jgi:hypothetical protein
VGRVARGAGARAHRRRGTDGSNPAPSSSESATNRVPDSIGRLTRCPRSEANCVSVSNRDPWKYPGYLFGLKSRIETWAGSRWAPIGTPPPSQIAVCFRSLR